MLKTRDKVGLIVLTVIAAAIGLNHGYGASRMPRPRPGTPECLRGVTLTAQELRPHLSREERDAWWYYGESAGEVMRRHAVQQRVLVDGGGDVYIKYSEFPGRREALAAANFHATHMAAVFDRRGPGGHTIGEACWTSRKSGGFAVLFQQGPFCVLIHSSRSGEPERSAMVEIGHRTSAKIARALATGLVASASAGMFSKASPRSWAEMDQEIRQAAEAIRGDPELAQRATVLLYTTMVGRARPRQPLELFIEVEATSIVREALMARDWGVIIDSAKYFERTGEISALPELVNALERNNYPVMTPLGETRVVHGVLQQGLVRAIASVTGLQEAAAAILPERPSREIEDESITDFVARVRAWAEERGIDMYPPEGLQLAERGPTLEERTDLLIEAGERPATQAARQYVVERLSELRKRIDRGLVAIEEAPEVD